MGLDVPTMGHPISVEKAAICFRSRETGLVAARWANTVRRLAGGLVLLLALAFAPAALAHGALPDSAQPAQDRSAGIAVIPDQDALAFPASSKGVPVDHGTNDACPTCCDAGACSMFSATLSDAPSVAVWLPKISADYGGSKVRDVTGVQSVPDTRPPRLAA